MTPPTLEANLARIRRHIHERAQEATSGHQTAEHDPDAIPQPSNAHTPAGSPIAMHDLDDIELWITPDTPIDRSAFSPRAIRLADALGRELGLQHHNWLVAVHVDTEQVLNARPARKATP